ncbi:MAG: hypothetical protein KDA37_17940, partial [Planctomycetales bacterium]|nr:hypothetical protein [Planctomycetales bacterium]
MSPIPMNYLSKLIELTAASRAQRRRAAKAPSDPPVFDAVTRLEKRLCLGGWAAAGVSDFAPQQSVETSVNDAVVVLIGSNPDSDALPIDPTSEPPKVQAAEVSAAGATDYPNQETASGPGVTLIGDDLLQVLPRSAFVAAASAEVNAAEESQASPGIDGNGETFPPQSVAAGETSTSRQPQNSDYGVSSDDPGSPESVRAYGQNSYSGLELPHQGGSAPSVSQALAVDDSLAPQALSPTAAQLTSADVELLLSRASQATASEDAIIAVVDRNGRILGVRAEQDVLDNFSGNDAGLVFAIDGAVAKARTAAMFSNGEFGGSGAALTSRTVRFLSQSTITQREVQSNPNVDGGSAAAAAASTLRGPGFVAPIGVGGHFPPEIVNTPPVDLFAIEHTNRDSNLHPGDDGVKGPAIGDDILLRTSGVDADGETLGRFNIDPAFVSAGQALYAPESYGHAENSNLLPYAQSRGIATLPGGIPLFRDADGDGVGDTLVGGIGVFFPGPDGYADFEQGFVAGIGQTEAERTNAPKVLEAEFIALAAAGGSLGADAWIPGSKVSDIGGMPAVDGLDLPFGRLDLVGITLEGIGPGSSKTGIRAVLDQGVAAGAFTGADSGADQPLVNSVDGMHRDGKLVPEGWLVNAHDSTAPTSEVLTAADVNQIISTAILAADETRAAVRLPLSSTTKMVFAITDTEGEVIGLYRMENATTFSLDVAVAKARNVAYYADAGALQAEDQVVEAGTAFTNRTFRFLSEPRYPSGIDGGPPPEFSILNDGNIDRNTAENLGTADPVSAFDSVLGFDAFTPMTNFRDLGDAGVTSGATAGTTDKANQNGIVFFPGSTPLYKNGVLVG